MAAKISFYLLDYLSFRANATQAGAWLQGFSESDWLNALTMSDTAGLTFHLLKKLRRQDHFGLLPTRIQERLVQNEQDHTARVAAMLRESLEFNRLFRSESIRYLTLKGLTCFPDFVDDLKHRVQYDHDFLIEQADQRRACELFLKLGYEPLSASDKLAVDHLPTLVKKTGWSWKGNLYDPEIPRAIELHFRLWDAEFELIPIQFPEVWPCSVLRCFEGEPIPALCREHALFYVVLHAFRHLVRNDLRLSHLYELAYFLHTHAEDAVPDCQGQTSEGPFWEGFERVLHGRGRSLQIAATMFKLAEHCFGNRLAPAAGELVRGQLSPASQLWIERFGRAEAVDCFRKSKSAVLLHLNFVDTYSARWKVVRRRWVPRHLPLPSFGVQTSKAQRDFWFRLQWPLRYGLQILRRIVFQVSSLSRFLIEFPVWHWRLYCHRKAQ
jgi:hypothetical protein